MLLDNYSTNKLIEESQNNSSSRSHLLFHDSIKDDIQQIAFCIQPETLIDVHKHLGGTETIICLRGAMAVTVWNDKDSEIFILNNQNPILKFNPKNWHTYTSLETNTIGFEIKEGPYNTENFIKKDKYIEKQKREELNEMIKNRL